MCRLAFALVTFLLATTVPISAQNVRSPEYFAAESYFNNTSARARTIAQVLLIATGHQNSVPTERFSQRTFAAISRFQADNGIYPNGRLDNSTEDKLSRQGREMLNLWDFSAISHPIMGNPIWMPQGMGVRAVPAKNGLAFQDPQKRVFVAYNYFPNASVDVAYNALRVKMASEGTVVHYAVAKDGWYVISATGRNGNDQYLRYHQYSAGLLGFSLFWNNDNGNVQGERIAILMSASLGAVLNGRPMVEPPGNGSDSTTNVAKAEIAPPRQNNSAYTPSPDPAPAVVNAPLAPVPPVTPKADDKGISTGTGFFIDAKGKFVTNAHVVKACSTVIVKLNDGKDFHKARVVGTDSTNDLALLDVESITENKFSPVRIGGRLGEGIAAFGYPHADVLATSGNFTLGNITALAGLGDDSRYFQVSAPVQSGNSGGPLLDSYGNAVGVVSSKLNVTKMAAVTGDMAQNVNFALKGSTLVQFLESNGVSATIGNVGTVKADPADIAETAKAVSGFVACQ